MRLPLLRPVLTLLILAGVVLVATACGSDENGSGSADAQPTKSCADVDLSSAPSKPVRFRIGIGRAAEEPLWLMEAKPDITRHDGKWYELDFQQFESSETKLVAYQAGKIDGLAGTTASTFRGTARGALDLIMVASVMRDGEPGAFSTTFVALESAGIQGPEDLKGKKIAHAGVGTDTEFLARAAVDEGGGNHDTDAEYVVLPFPAMEDALRQGQVDVVSLPEPFYTVAHSKGGVTDVFSARDITGTSFDLLTMLLDRGFVAKNTEAVCAFREDFARASKWYTENRDAARKVLVEKKFSATPLEVYLKSGDYGRNAQAAVTPKGLETVMDRMIEVGVLNEADRFELDDELFISGITLRE